MDDYRAGIWAVVPAKNLDNAKQRLAAVLDRDERAGLYRAMLEDVLVALRASRVLAGVVVVTADATLAMLARGLEARVIAEVDNRGQTAAVAAAARDLARSRGVAMLSIPGDVPLVTGADVDSFLSGDPIAPVFRIAPDRARRGSNAILCAPPQAVPLQFGDDSFAPHLRAARARGLEPQVRELPNLALDVDRPDDLEAFLAVESATRSYRWLDASGVLARLKSNAAQPMQLAEGVRA